MAEGMTRLNQQVVGIEGWGRVERVQPIHGLPASDPAQRNEPYRDGDVRRAVEAEIVPRLLLGRDQPALNVPPPAGALSDAEIQGFAHLLLSQTDDVAVLACLARMRAGGRPVDFIYLELFQPAARYIGELWLQDLCTFVDVTLAVGTMQKLLRTFGPEFHKDDRPADSSRLAMLAPLPGDQHTFGLSMVAEFFRRGGWSVLTPSFNTLEDLGERVHSTWFAVVGFSVSGEDRLAELASAIQRVRGASLNAAIGVMVGGSVFLDRPDLAQRVGADVLGTNAIQALAGAEGFASLAPGF